MTERTQQPGRALAWILLAIAILVAVGGVWLGLYERWPWYDSMAHGVSSFGGTFAVAWWLYGRALTGARGAPLHLLAVVLLVGLGLGAIWEAAEYVYDHVNGPGSTILGKPDTIHDLGWDALGALAAGGALLAVLRTRARDPDTQ